MDKTLAMLLAGGQGSRLNILASHRAKPAVPFFGMYRIIDFTLSNIMNSGITNVGILTQYKPSSLIDHIQTGDSWDFYGSNRSATILPPYKGEDEASWYEGTADAIFQNIDFMNNFENTDKVLILSGDHIYQMNYQKLLDVHKQRGADLTVVAMDVPIEEASRFGTIIVDKNDRVVDFDEKPKNPRSTLASLGIYVFDKELLIKELRRDSLREDSTRDFGRDIVTNMLNKKVYIHRFEGYWKDVGTIDSYWETSMELLHKRHNNSVEKWHVRTNLNRKIVADRNPAYISKKGEVVSSLICDGCVIKGKVINSILSPGVVVEENVVVKDSIIFNDSVIGNKSIVDRCIIDKDVVIGRGCVIGKGKFPGRANVVFPSHLYTGITVVGKASNIPSGVTLGRNCIVYPLTTNKNFKKKNYVSGETIQRSLS